MNDQINKLMSETYTDSGSMFAEMLCADSDVNVKIAEAWNAQPDDVRMRIFQRVEDNQVQFALSIIQRCIQTIEDNTPVVENPQMEDYWDLGHRQGMLDAVHHIQEHFGVSL